LLLGEGVKDALEQGPVLVAMHPMLVCVRLDLLEFEAGIRMEAKPEPILSWWYEVTDKQTLCCPSQVQHSYYLVNLASADWTDGTARCTDEFG
jgi:hypothetical protein